MALQAIRTCYRGPTNAHGARMVAHSRAPVSQVWMPYDSGLSEDENHKAVAMACLMKLHEHAGWARKTMVAGPFRGDYYWVYQHTNTCIVPNQG